MRRGGARRWSVAEILGRVGANGEGRREKGRTQKRREGKDRTAKGQKGRRRTSRKRKSGSEWLGAGGAWRGEGIRADCGRLAAARKEAGLVRRRRRRFPQGNSQNQTTAEFGALLKQRRAQSGHEENATLLEARNRSLRLGSGLGSGFGLGFIGSGFSLIRLFARIRHFAPITSPGGIRGRVGTPIAGPKKGET